VRLGLAFHRLKMEKLRILQGYADADYTGALINEDL